MSLSFEHEIWMFDNNSGWYFIADLWDLTVKVEEVKEKSQMGKWKWEDSPE